MKWITLMSWSRRKILHDKEKNFPWTVYSFLFPYNKYSPVDRLDLLQYFEENKSIYAKLSSLLCYLRSHDISFFTTNVQHNNMRRWWWWSSILSNGHPGVSHFRFIVLLLVEDEFLSNPLSHALFLGHSTLP